MKFIKENWLMLVVFILVILLIANYFYTFSGFVTYTETERRGCTLLRYVFKLPVEERTEKYKTFSTENKEVVGRYVNQFLANERRCKTIQKFYIEELFLGLFIAGLLMKKNRERNRKNEKK